MRCLGEFAELSGFGVESLSLSDVRRLLIFVAIPCFLRLPALKALPSLTRCGNYAWPFVGQSRSRSRLRNEGLAHGSWRILSDGQIEITTAMTC